MLRAPLALSIDCRCRWKSLLSRLPKLISGYCRHARSWSRFARYGRSGAPTRERTSIPCVSLRIAGLKLLGHTCWWFIAATGWNACWWATWKSVAWNRNWVCGYGVERRRCISRGAACSEMRRRKIAGCWWRRFRSSWKREGRSARYLETCARILLCAGH